MTMVERLDEEFVKVLKGCDAHSHEYVARLKDEPRVVKILNEAQKLVDRSGSNRDLCRIYLKRIEHIYFKFDPAVIQQKHVITIFDHIPNSSLIMSLHDENIVLQF